MVSGSETTVTVARADLVNVLVIETFWVFQTVLGTFLVVVKVVVILFSAVLVLK